MIEKIIHQFWVSKGNHKPLPNAEKGLASVEILDDDWKVMRWDTSNFDMNISQFTRDTYNNCLYGLTSDYIRMYALYHYGGIYLDADVEILKPLDELLDNDLFFGWEHEDQNPKFLGTAIIGAKKGNPVIKYMLDFYDQYKFIKEDERLQIFQSNQLFPRLMSSCGIDIYQPNDKITIYDQNILYPYPWSKTYPKESLTVHRNMGTWLKRFGIIVPVVNSTYEQVSKCLETLSHLNFYNHLYQIIIVVGDENMKELVEKYKDVENFQIIYKFGYNMQELLQIGFNRSHARKKICMPSTHIISPDALIRYDKALNMGLNELFFNNIPTNLPEKYFIPGDLTPVIEYIN